MSSTSAAFPPTSTARESTSSLAALLPYVAIGAFLGVVMIKGEIVSWFRIQEMFRFQGFHIYGVLGTACLTSFISIQLLTRTGARAFTGEPIEVARKALRRGAYRYWLGGTIFGIGWGLTGACVGPLFALAGAGFPVFAVAIVSALFGAWLYALARPHLPH